MRAVFLVVALGALGCDGDPAGLPDLSVVTVDIEPGDAELAVGDTLRLTALPRTADGSALGSVDVEWEVEGPVEMTVLHGGYVLRVKALEPGEVAITATSEGKSGHTTLTVTSGPVDLVTIDLDSIVLEEGAARQRTKRARRTAGEQEEFGPAWVRR